MKVTAEAPTKLSLPRPHRILSGTLVKLKDLLERTELADPLGRRELDIEVASVACDSREAQPGSLFVAIRGEKLDGNQFVLDAVSRGAGVVVSESPRMAGVADEVVWVRAMQPRKALATIAANFFGNPAQQLQLVGITGTNGKTTTSYLVDSILSAAGHKKGLFGTIEYRTPAALRRATTTTPESLDLHRFLLEVVSAGGTHAVLEASSHALALDRLWGCKFAVAVFTNLTQDHLDFHKNIDAYRAAKLLLFEGTGAGRPEAGVINLDDLCGKQLAGLAARTITYGLGSGAQVTTKKYAALASGLEFTADTPAGKIDVRSRLLGRINVYNLLAAIGAGVALGVSREHIEAGISALEAVPGRFERVELGQPFLVVVDYAHTDDALRNLIGTARELASAGRVITLFGCGGDRDRGKRPLMGEAAGKLSDVVVLTSDNPRSEDPLLIINDVLVGLQRTSAKVVTQPNRENAIELAIEQARPGDVVLLAGKGHETKQVIKDRTVEFDDREVARRVLRERGYGQ
jgi:UDP-N-acetylmuramoyl-L-alanyl-D-glutamate--2,6-diaminopimelate ligase